MNLNKLDLMEENFENRISKLTDKEFYQLRCSEGKIN